MPHGDDLRAAVRRAGNVSPGSTSTHMARATVVVTLLLVAARAQSTPPEDLDAYLANPTPEREARVLAHGEAAVNDVQKVLSTIQGRREDTDDVRDRNRRLLSLLTKFGPAAGPTFARVVEASEGTVQSERVHFVATLSALAPFRAEDERLSSRWLEICSKTNAIDDAEAHRLLASVQRTFSRCAGAPPQTVADALRLLDSKNPWRVELAIETLARLGDRSAPVLAKLRTIAGRDDPRILFTTTRVPLRRAAARLVLQLEPEATDAKELRGILLGETRARSERALPAALQARIAECIAALDHEAQRTEARAALQAIGEPALVPMANALALERTPAANRVLLELLAEQPALATSALPTLLDRLDVLGGELQFDLLESIARIAPWSLDRVPLFHWKERDGYSVLGRFLPLPPSGEANRSIRILRLACCADAACSLDELREMLRDDDVLVRDVAVGLAAARLDDARRLVAELDRALDAFDQPARPEPRRRPTDEDAWRAEHLHSTASLLARVAEETSPELAHARRTLQELKNEPERSQPQAKGASERVADVLDLHRRSRSAEAAAETARETPITPRVRSLAEFVKALGTAEGPASRESLLAGGAEAARALRTGLDENEAIERTRERLELLTRLGPAAAGEYEALQRAARHRPLRAPVEFARTIGEIAPYRAENAGNGQLVPLVVMRLDGVDDPSATNQLLALERLRFETRHETRADAPLPALLELLHSRRPYRVELAVELLAQRGRTAFAAAPFLRQMLRGTDPRVLRTDRVIPLREAAARALLAIEPDAAHPSPKPVTAEPVFPERALARSRELVRDLLVPERRADARTVLGSMGPVAVQACSEFVTGSSDLCDALEVLDCVLIGDADTSLLTTRLLEQLSTSKPEERLRLLALLAFAAPYSRDVVMPPRRDVFDVALLHDIDLFQGFDRRTRLAVAAAADELAAALEVDPGVPSRALAGIPKNWPWFRRVHALRIVAGSREKIPADPALLMHLLDTDSQLPMFALALGDRQREWFQRCQVRTVATLILAQSEPDSPEAQKARLRLAELDAKAK